MLNIYSAGILFLVHLCLKPVYGHLAQSAINATVHNQNLSDPAVNRVSLRSFLKELSHTLQLPSDSNAFSAPEIRQVVCRERIVHLLHNATFYNCSLHLAQAVAPIEYNHSLLAQIICELEAQKSYEEYFFALWANSTERFVGKTLLENTINPILQTIVLLSLIGLACPIFHQLAHSNLRLGLWHFLYVYSLVGCVRALLVYLPNLILRFVALIQNRPRITQYAKLDNFGVLACPTFNFVDQVLVFMPNSIVPILLWDQILRQQRKVHRSGSYTPNVTPRKERHDSTFSHLPTGTSTGSGGANCDGNSIRVCSKPARSLNKTRYETRGSISISTQNTLIHDGITTFGAKLVTITVFVLHAFVQVHTLWLYTFVKGKCNFDRQEHSTVFSVGYPYFLRVSLCLVPDLICIAGLLQLIWTRITTRLRSVRSQPAPIAKPALLLPSVSGIKQTLTISGGPQPEEELTPWNGPEQFGGRTLFVRKCRSCVVRIQLGKKTAESFCDHLQTNGNQSNAKRPWTENGSVPVGEETQTPTSWLISNPKADLNMAITLACCLLTFTMPQDIEWLGLHKMRHTGDNNFVKNYQLLKFSELAKQLMECWFLLGWVLFMPLMFITNPLVRLQFIRLYCHRIRCKRRQCRFCYCGYYCDADTGEQESDQS